MENEEWAKAVGIEHGRWPAGPRVNGPPKKWRGENGEGRVGGGPWWCEQPETLKLSILHVTLYGATKGVACPTN